MKDKYVRKRYKGGDMDRFKQLQTVYFAGGCLWGVQEFMKSLPGVINTEAGRANGTTNTLESPYDGYTECVKTTYNPSEVTLDKLMDYFFEIIDPYSVNKQGEDVGEKYRSGVYSKDKIHLETVTGFINRRDDLNKIAVEVLPLSNYVRSAEEHQDRLSRCPEDYCHITKEILHKYLKD